MRPPVRLSGGAATPGRPSLSSEIAAEARCISRAPRYSETSGRLWSFVERWPPAVVPTRARLVPQSSAREPR
jgi:hypothetical protein